MLGVGELNADNVPREASVGGGWGYADPVIAAIRRVIQDAAAPTGPNFEPRAATARNAVPGSTATSAFGWLAGNSASGAPEVQC